MSGIVDSVLAKLGPDQVNAIATQLGVEPAQAQNASTPQVAGALHEALGDHAGLDIGSVLNNVLGGGGASVIGGAILGHVFGGNQAAANQGLGQVTGLGQQNAGQLLAMLAPIVMAALANHVQNRGIDPGALGGMLGQQSQQIQQNGGLVGGLLSAVLSHGGGNLDLSHLLQGAGGLLGGFGRR